MEQQTKICPSCGKKLPLTEFYKNKNRTDGYASMCKVCEKAKYGRRERRTSQQITQATLSLIDFDDPQLFAELRRRGYTGELRFSKTITV